MTYRMEEIVRWSWDEETDRFEFHATEEPPGNEEVEARIHIAKVKAGVNPFFEKDVHTPHSLEGEECVT